MNWKAVHYYSVMALIVILFITFLALFLTTDFRNRMMVLCLYFIAYLWYREIKKES